MDLIRFAFIAIAIGVAVISGAGQAHAEDSERMSPSEVVITWYRLSLELVRHTPTYSPPVASRAFGYVGVTAFEAIASGSDDLTSLAGQVNGLDALPAREEGADYDDAVVVQAATAHAIKSLFSNTGPTGQRAFGAMERRLAERAATGLAHDIVQRSTAHGIAVADHILAWSLEDGGAIIENMGFPQSYDLTEGPAHWVPTSLVAQQQSPLLPDWGNNRPFAMPEGGTCGLPPPPEYSEEPDSEFYREAYEVYEAKTNLTPEHRDIALFWSDDPMLSPTPPGHWISIAIQILQDNQAGIDETVDVLARLGMGMADAFIGCWHAKFEYDLVRPITYIRRVIDPKWEPLLNTPPFPEYPSGHSTQSGTAAAILTAIFGDNFAFEDITHVDDGLAGRHFANFHEAAEEAALSRLYGGIHFRAAIDLGLEQGHCIAAYITALKTR
ncbi:vanadium-dependent haloperoxidase [Mesorhizobium sp. CAU 1732]|uniref:vanadium-dependent haloperoxidase n=1 Tax=Mesorhizobium sp. CAU 1732 TaxID=3140358 RepID=UPI0032614A9F